MAATINKDMIIADMLKIDPGIAAILMASGMHCIGCPSAQGYLFGAPMPISEFESRFMPAETDFKISP